ncbi:hypothetical protein ACIQPQ_35150 [Streptomyces sp. NPDC091281]|uniref:hypothetical protein n=1 Tax=Streptomyces sp. NPDC091281 TaxID=3365985 RepID=UPI0037F6F60E
MTATPHPYPSAEEIPAASTTPDAATAPAEPTPPETGWSRARRLRRAPSAPRTSVPAREASGTAVGGARPARSGPEGHIVRGED